MEGFYFLDRMNRRVVNVDDGTSKGLTDNVNSCATGRSKWDMR